MASAEPPTSVPEPGSSYNTPATTSVPLPEETNRTSIESKPAEPSVAQSPSSTSEYFEPRPQTPPAANVERSEPLSLSPPSRTGSPGAPPLPRRAAARRRVPPPPVDPPAPAADVSLTEVVKQLNGHHTEETEARAEPDSKVDIPSPVVIAPETEALAPSSEEQGDPPKAKTENEEGGQADVLPAAEPTGSAVQEQETSGAEAEIVDVAVEAVEPDGDQSDEQQKPELLPEPRLSADSSTPHDDDAAIENSGEAVGTTTTPNDVDAEPERPNGLEMKIETAETAVEEKEKEKPAATPDAGKARQPPLPPRQPPVRSPERRVLSSSMGRLDTGKSPATAEPVYARDGTPYVGDATWEERTWKELTRLREDMFWARLGSAQ